MAVNCEAAERKLKDRRKGKDREMHLTEDTCYLDDLDRVLSQDLPWERLGGKTFLISGATGLLGSTLIDVLMRRRAEDPGVQPAGRPGCCTVIALGRSVEKAKSRFAPYWDNGNFFFLPCNINDAVSLKQSLDGFFAEQAARDRGPRKADFVCHAASNTHPVAYARDPIGTVVTNIIGLNNLLDYASTHGCERFLFASSNEIYGENRGDAELFDEAYCGYIDCNTLRAGYPESKRAGEALCQAYISQKGLDAVIVRFTRSFGPALLGTDTKALSQFLKKGVAGEDIVLKSEGKQFYSYTYAADAVSGLLYCLLKGVCGQAYNVADEACNITLRDLAGMIADYAGTKVVFELPDAVEAAGYSKATKALLDGSKLKELGWRMQFDMKTGLEHTLEILKRSCG